MDELRATSQFSSSILHSESREGLLSEYPGDVRELTSDLIGNTAQESSAEVLAADLGLGLDDIGYVSPRLEHEVPLISKSLAVESGIESEQSGGVVIGAAGILSLEPGHGGISGHTLDAESSSLLGLMERERRKLNAHMHYLDGGVFAGPKEDEHFYQEFEHESRVYEQSHYADNMKARIASIGSKHPLSMQATEAKIQRYEELMERVSKIGTDEKYQNLPSPKRDHRSKGDKDQSPLNLGSPTKFNLNLHISPARSPRDKEEYTSANGDPWETHIKTMQDRAREAAQERKDDRVARSLVMNANILDDSAKGVPTMSSTYRKQGIGYEYEGNQLRDANMFFEEDYLRKITAESTVLGTGNYDHYEPSKLVDESALPQPLAGVLDEIKAGNGKTGLDLNDPPVLSPSKKELDDYISSIPGMKRFSPREPLGTPSDTNPYRKSSPRFSARAITESRSQHKKQQVSGRDLSPSQKARVKRKVKKEISEAEKKALMRKALEEAERFIKMNGVM